MRFLFYEAYEEMAIKVIQQIVQECLGKVDGHHRVFVGHRIGTVALCESSILIAVSSPHRASGHEMVMNILNEIKQKVPIWKKVVYENEKDQHWSAQSECFWLQK